MSREGAGDVIWMRPEHAATGRPAKRSREEITTVAVTIADQDGLDAVSIRRIAPLLGTGAASLRNGVCCARPRRRFPRGGGLPCGFPLRRTGEEQEGYLPFRPDSEATARCRQQASSE